MCITTIEEETLITHSVTVYLNLSFCFLTLALLNICEPPADFPSITVELSLGHTSSILLHFHHTAQFSDPAYLHFYFLAFIHTKYACRGLN